MKNWTGCGRSAGSSGLFPGPVPSLSCSSPENVFKGLIGRYGRVNGAPHYIAFIGNVDEARMQEATGYMGEGIVLEATALGLGTCWVGGFFRADAVRRDLALAENERVLSITPVGYPVTQEDFSERLLEGLAGSRRRNPLTSLFFKAVLGLDRESAGGGPARSFGPKPPALALPGSG